MAITAGTADFLGEGPSQTGQILAGNLSDPDARSLVGTCSVTGATGDSTYNCNYIDGSKTLGFTPSGILCNRIGGSATATTAVVSCVPTDGTKFAVKTSASFDATTLILAFKVLK